MTLDVSTTLSPRRNPANSSDSGPISGSDFLKIHNSHLRFYFQGMPSGAPNFIPKTLYIPHANGIRWDYSLNTNVQSTYGGEVIQILSCYAGPITITGQVADHYSGSKFVSGADELKRIYEWFRWYMIKAGGAGKSVIRNEAAIVFDYPERGWKLYIQPTALKGFAYGTERLAQEWSITAEVVTDNDLNYFSQMSLAAFTDPELKPELGRSISFDFNPEFTFGVGAPGDPRTDPNSPLNKMTAQAFSKFGDNFQQLLAAWTGGNFAQWGFNELTSADANGLDANTSTYFQNIFGSDVVGTPGGTSGSGSGTPSGSSGGTGGGVYQGQTDLASGANATWISDVIAGLGAKVTVQDQNFMYSWWVSEGTVSTGSSNFNWLNTTLDANKYPTFGQGISEYPNYATGIKETINTLKGYSNIVAGLKAGDPYSSPGVTGDLETWVSGNATGNPAYAAQVLGRYSTSTTPQGDTNGSGTTSSSQAYANPLRNITNLSPERIDMGVDYAGSGPVYAIGPGVINYYNQLYGSTGWPSPGSSSGGAFINYTLTSGPAKGLSIYVAENVKLNPNLRVGSTVDSNTELGTLIYGSPNMETGWAQSGVDLTMASSFYNEGDLTSFGKNFSDLLVSLGAPAGTTDGRSMVGSLPPNWPTWR